MLHNFLWMIFLVQKVYIINIVVLPLHNKSQ